MNSVTAFLCGCNFVNVDGQHEYETMQMMVRLTILAHQVTYPCSVSVSTQSSPFKILFAVLLWTRVAGR